MARQKRQKPADPAVCEALEVNIAQDGDIVCLDQSLADEYSATGKPHPR